VRADSNGKKAKEKLLSFWWLSNDRLSLFHVCGSNIDLSKQINVTLLWFDRMPGASDFLIYANISSEFYLGIVNSVTAHKIRFQSDLVLFVAFLLTAKIVKSCGIDNLRCG